MKTKARVFKASLFLITWGLRVVVGEEVRPEQPCHFPAIYTFGDSNSDTGAGSAAFYLAILPSGETFFHRPVGRGCDGRIVIDFIGIFELLKQPSCNSLFSFLLFLVMQRAYLLL